MISMHECDNCGQLWPETSIVKPIPNLLERIEPGNVVPSGECPECYTLCYPLEDLFTNEDGDMLGSRYMPGREGKVLFCGNPDCENTARERVFVSVNRPHDAYRLYRASCYAVYMVGVQHGRHHEAARLGHRAGNDSSQDYPTIQGPANAPTEEA